MSVVTASRYNALQSKVAAVLGTGSSDKGYGMTLASAQVGAGDTINATHLSLLHTDINKCILHQTGSATSAIVAPATADIIEESNSTNKKGWAQYEAEATVAETNRLTANAGNMATVSEITESRTSAWGSSPDTVNTTFTVTFSSADIKRNFFNAGGEIRMALSLSGGSGSKGTSWSNLFSGAGTIKFGRTATTTTGSGTTTSIGNVDMTGSHQTIFSKDVGSGVYGENDFNITARDNSSTVLEFIVTLNDDDAGDQTGTGGPVDENVGGTTTLTVSSFHANNASAVQHARPTYSVTDNFN
tara:strand:- start:4882 stop:5784 length:903 start_codon:yes stop_codon:yes gene_type:complete